VAPGTPAALGALKARTLAFSSGDRQSPAPSGGALLVQLLVQPPARDFQVPNHTSAARARARMATAMPTISREVARYEPSLLFFCRRTIQ
jgi:hypothetical protein